MHDFAPLPRLLAALSLTIPLLSAAQAPAMTDAERARRDADKVLSFIKFQTVKTKPAAEQADKPRKPVTPSPQRPAIAARPAQAAVTAATAAPVVTAAEPPAAEPVRASAETGSVATVEQAAARISEQEAPSRVSPATNAPAEAPAAVAANAADKDDEDEEPLQMQYFVEPMLPRGAQAPFVSRTRTVTVRFTVETNGKVSKAEANADSPRRLARSATDAVLQWQFAPLSQPRTVDVEIAFKPD